MMASPEQNALEQTMIDVPQFVHAGPQSLEVRLDCRKSQIASNVGVLACEGRCDGCQACAPLVRTGCASWRRVHAARQQDFRRTGFSRNKHKPR